MDGGILEAFGRLLKHNVRIYVYPSLDSATGELITVENMEVCLMKAEHGILGALVAHSAQQSQEDCTWLGCSSCVCVCHACQCSVGQKVP